MWSYMKKIACTNHGLLSSLRTRETYRNANSPRINSSPRATLSHNIYFKIVSTFVFPCTMQRAPVLTGWNSICTCKVDSSVEFVSVPAGLLVHYSTRSHVWASSRSPVCDKISIWIPCTRFALPFTRILRPEPWAPASAHPTSHPSSWILFASQLPSFSSIFMTTCNCTAQ